MGWSAAASCRWHLHTRVEVRRGMEAERVGTVGRIGEMVRRCGADWVVVPVRHKKKLPTAARLHTESHAGASRARTVPASLGPGSAQSHHHSRCLPRAEA